MYDEKLEKVPNLVSSQVAKEFGVLDAKITNILQCLELHEGRLNEKDSRMGNFDDRLEFTEKKSENRPTYH